MQRELEGHTSWSCLLQAPTTQGQSKETAQDWPRASPAWPLQIVLFCCLQELAVIHAHNLASALGKMF